MSEFYDSPRHEFRTRVPLQVSAMRWLTVLTFAFVSLNVLTWGQLGNDRPMLPQYSITMANQMLDGLLAKAQTAGAKYTFDYGAADLDQLVALSRALQGYQGSGIADQSGPVEAFSLQRHLECVRGQIGDMALYNSGVRERGPVADSYYSTQAMSRYLKTHAGALRPSFLPPPPINQGINWRSVTRRGVDGWLLAMIPAYLTILLSFRLRRESLWAELVERPWWPLLSTVC